MQDRYTIGETAKLLGVTSQTLRYYDKCGLLRPSEVDERTGYRYYSFNQFHAIDRIKYLQSLGMPLEDIKYIMDSGTLDRMVAFLKKQREVKKREMEELQETLDTIDWYIDYSTYLSKTQNADTLYKVHLPLRYAMGVPCYPDDIPIAKMEVRLAEAKARPELRNLKYLRQYAYMVDYDQLAERKFSASRYFIYLHQKPDFDTDYLITLPEGEYLCYRARILTDYWDPSPLKEFFTGESPKFVIANEFEENLVEYAETMYELQILL